MPAPLLFTPYAPSNLEPKNSVGARWSRLLERLDLAAAVAGRRTAIKMHLGGGHGFTTIHPFFVRRLVAAVRAAGAREVYVTDEPGNLKTAIDRGYTEEVLGCPLVPTIGDAGDRFVTEDLTPPFRSLASVDLARAVVEAEALIDLAHIKGHGACGFGGASKNLSMGCVTPRTKGALHALEGGLQWVDELCTHCRACAENCPRGAISFKPDDTLSVFFHHCTFCQHCTLICPVRAIQSSGGTYRDFQTGMARTTDRVLARFEPGRVLFISLLMNITIWCDCWGMTTPALVPDIGILAGRDIVAMEQAALDLVRAEAVIPGALPPGVTLGPGRHLFEQIHGKDPYVIVEELAALGRGAREYTLETVE